MKNAAEIINQWDSPREFADDIGSTSVNVRAMRRLNSIPDKYWKVLVEKASERGIDGISLEVLAELADQKRKASASTEPAKG